MGALLPDPEKVRERLYNKSFLLSASEIREAIWGVTRALESAVGPTQKVSSADYRGKNQKATE